jgi:hypothetical protein
MGHDEELTGAGEDMSIDDDMFAGGAATGDLDEDLEEE